MVEVALAMLLLPRVVVPAAPTSTVTESEVLARVVWLPLAEEFPIKLDDTLTEALPLSKVMVVLISW